MPDRFKLPSDVLPSLGRVMMTQPNTVIVCKVGAKQIPELPHPLDCSMIRWDLQTFPLMRMVWCGGRFWQLNPKPAIAALPLNLSL